MATLILIINLVIHQSETMIVKKYGEKHKTGGMFFNALICLFSMLFFILTDKNGFYFPAKLWIYGIVSVAMFAGGFYGMYGALKSGSFAITKLISSFNGIFIIAYGLMFLKEPANAFTYIAIALVFLSVFLANYKGKTEERLSIKWLMWVLVVVVTNGFIGILQKMQQLEFEGKCDNEFMIISLLGAFVSLMIMGLVFERDNLKYILKHSIPYGAIAGICNGGTNLTNLLLYLYMPVSLASPLKSGLGIVAGFVISASIYKEKFTRLQLLGAVCGTVAIILFKFC